MIAFKRTASIAPGKMAQAIGFAQEIKSYLKRSYDIDLEIQVPIGGNPNRIGWATRYTDLAAYDAATAQMTADKAYWEMVSKASDLFIAGSVEDTLWRSV